MADLLKGVFLLYYKRILTAKITTYLKGDLINAYSGYSKLRFRLSHLQQNRRNAGFQPVYADETPALL
jgi:hypothetical protein